LEGKEYDDGCFSRGVLSWERSRRVE